MNVAIIIGHVGKDIFLNKTNNGQDVCNMSVATDGSYTTKEGERVEKVDWHQVTMFGTLAKNCAEYLRKGSKVAVTAKMTTQKGKSKDLKTEYVNTVLIASNVEFLTPKSSDDAPQPAYNPSQPNPAGNQTRQVP